MATNARHIKAHLHGEMDRALQTSTVAVAMVAFLAVIREGLETAIFLWAGIRSSGEATPRGSARSSASPPLSCWASSCTGVRYDST